ncbi:hypothetical protein EDB83DRAFT_2514211 [Lactarius deliciosus]|nr:hypothetical protein EDB83DRAFT_2514211 [Lactarius deliciosus]
MRAYIALARQVSPCCPSRRVIYIVDSYVRLRKQSKDDLARALAWLRFAAAVLHADVDEALRLMVASKESLHDKDRDDADARDADRSDTSRYTSRT